MSADSVSGCSDGVGSSAGFAGGGTNAACWTASSPSAGLRSCDRIVCGVAGARDEAIGTRPGPAQPASSKVINSANRFPIAFCIETPRTDGPAFLIGIFRLISVTDFSCPVGGTKFANLSAIRPSQFAIQAAFAQEARHGEAAE
jgi:hypothetical protein